MNPTYGVLLASALVGLSGCGGSDTIIVQVQDGTTALVSSNDTSGSDAEVRGVIQIGPGGCLGLVYEGTTQPTTTLIWPEGSKLTEAGDAVDVPELGVVRVGQTISGGGGAVTSPRGDRYAGIPDACLDRDVLVEADTISSVS